MLAPASILNLLLAKYTNDTFNIVNNQGSLWRGSGQLISKLETVGIEPIAPIRWQLNLNALLKGKVTISLLMANKPSTISWDGKWSFNIQNIPIPIAIANNFIPKDMLITWRDLRASGNITLVYLKGTSDTQGLSPNLQAQINWQSAAMAVFPLNPIGDYSLDINYENKNGSLQIKTLKGPLAIIGSGKVTANRFIAEIDFEPSAETQNTFIPILQFWGKAIDNGKKYHITLGDLSG